MSRTVEDLLQSWLAVRISLVGETSSDIEGDTRLVIAAAERWAEDLGINFSLPAWLEERLTDWDAWRAEGWIR